LYFRSSIKSNYIGIDISPEYCEMAQQKIKQENMMNRRKCNEELNG